MARKQSDTSVLSYEKIMAPGARESTYKKIILALEWIIDGTNYEIAVQARLKPEKVWKRTGKSELCKPDENGVSVLVDTGLRRNSPDGNPCIVYTLYENKDKYAHIEKPIVVRKDEMTAVDYANKIIAGAKRINAAKETIIQSSLFNQT